MFKNESFHNIRWSLKYGTKKEKKDLKYRKGDLSYLEEELSNRTNS